MFKVAPNTTHSHAYTSLASYNDQPFVTGGYKHSKTEYMNPTNDKNDEYQWTSFADYPFYHR